MQDLTGHLMESSKVLSELDSLLLDCYEQSCTFWHEVLNTHLLNMIMAHAHKLRVLQLGCRLPKLVMPLGSLQHIILSVGQSEACLVWPRPAI